MNTVYAVLVTFLDGTSNVSQEAFYTLRSAQKFCLLRGCQIDDNGYVYKDHQGHIQYEIKSLNVVDDELWSQNNSNYALYKVYYLLVHANDTYDRAFTHVVGSSVSDAERRVIKHMKKLEPSGMLRDVHIMKVRNLKV